MADIQALHIVEGRPLEVLEMRFYVKKSRNYWLLKKGRLNLGELCFTFKAVCERERVFSGLRF